MATAHTQGRIGRQLMRRTPIGDAASVELQAAVRALPRGDVMQTRNFLAAMTELAVAAGLQKAGPTRVAVE